MIDSRKIEDLHPAVKRGAMELIRRMKEKGYDVGISSTYRDNERQSALYAQGRTTAGKVVTQAKAGQSMHNYRLAFDIFKNVKGQEFSDANFFKTAGKIWTEMGGQWGGSWIGFVDTPHMEFTNKLTLTQLQQGKTLPQDIKMNWELQQNPQPITKTTENAKTTKYKVINVSTSLNIRSDSNAKASIVGKLKNGDIIEVLLTANNFAKISKGWVSMDYIEKIK